MPKIPKGKEALYVIIDSKLASNLRKLIIKKYGEYRKGLLSAEVEAALYAWIATHKSTQTDSEVREKVNPTPRFYKVWQQVKSWIANRYGIDFNEVHQVPARMLRQAIAATRGTDPRTIRKWMQVFTNQKLIKWVDVEMVEIRG